jgi:hypothetical protein
MTERTRETKREDELVTKKKEESVEFLSNLSRKPARPTIRCDTVSIKSYG